MKVKAVCDKCRKEIQKNECIYFFKHNDEVDFCSRQCAERYAIDNLDIRIKQ